MRLSTIGLLLALAPLCLTPAPPPTAIDYPLDGTLFPPDIAAPTFLWHGEAAAGWQVEVSFEDGGLPIQAVSGQPRWKPEPEIWAAIKQRSVAKPATFAVHAQSDSPRATVHMQTSQDPVGAPIFYRDVPLMPSEVEKGVIKPLAPAAIPLIAWRLRYPDEPRSRLVLEGLHTCTNCHSFSRDGKTLGMDVDGPENDKGTYAIASIAPRMSVATRDVITWNSFPGKPAGNKTIGFLSQISPDGQYAMTTLNEELYVANFKDYRFLQVFYPTRGILAWYSRATGKMKSLPGANDPRYVQTGGVWSPDGDYLVFARAEARDPYPAGRKLAEYAGDPNELPIQYDLYRVPFRGGQGGTPQPVAGASRNGMSNSFPKVSPDGRWIVFVQSRNGQLMRPDGQLYIVRSQGGEARKMRCNTPLMNSWHSFSPNGRWMVFSSKSRSPYTQMYLTHLDEQGRDTPPVLIEDATVPDHAVNIPEFLNIPRDGLLQIEMPAAEFYRLFDSALALEQKGQHAAAVAEWQRALALDGENPKARTNLGIALWQNGARDDAMVQFRKAVALKNDYPEAHNNLGVALLQTGQFAEATRQFEMVLAANPDSGEAHNNLGYALLKAGRPSYAAGHFRRVLALNPDNLPVLTLTAWLLATSPDASVRNGKEAVKLAERALRLSGGRDPEAFDTLAAAHAEAGRFSDAVATAKQGLALAPGQEDCKARLALYEKGVAYRDKR